MLVVKKQSQRQQEILCENVVDSIGALLLSLSAEEAEEGGAGGGGGITITGAAAEEFDLAVARLADLRFGSCVAKIKELIVAADMPNTELLAGTNGADARDHVRHCNVEIKVSQPVEEDAGVARKHDKSNILFSSILVAVAGAGAGAGKGAKAKKGKKVKKVHSLSAAIAAKQSADNPGEDYIKIVINHVGAGAAPPASSCYEINAQFLHDYFAHVPSPETTDLKCLDGRANYNLGSNRCLRCRGYHRIERFVEASRAYLARALPKMTDRQYIGLRRDCKAQC
jgi:hypothetical protein